MNAIFGTLNTEGLEKTEDRLGGFAVLESNAYLGTIKAAYAGQSAGGARNVTLILDLGGREYSETVYVTNKKGENWFLNKQDNTKKVPLPGFTTIEDLCLVTTNKTLSEQTAEDKMMNVYDPEAKKELPKSVPMLVELIGKQATFGILKQIENKNEKNGAGEYVAIADTRESNVIDKIFHHPSNMTVVEAREQAGEAVFMPAWVERNKGKDRDRRSIKDGQAGKAGRPGVPPTAGDAGAAKTASLFG